MLPALLYHIIYDYAKDICKYFIFSSLIYDVFYAVKNHTHLAALPRRILPYNYCFCAEYAGYAKRLPCRMAKQPSICL